MSVPRLASALALLLVSCAGWDSSTPSYASPPEQPPAPSHHAPSDASQPPADPASTTLQAAIASVQLLDDCPDPEVARQKRSANSPDTGANDFRRACTQSTVQLSLRSELAGVLQVDAVRVLDAASKRVAGPATVRAPTLWDAGTGTYVPWDGRVTAGADLKVSYKLGAPDLSRAAELIGPEFNTYAGPFLLEIDVSIGGQRWTLRSGEFTREPLDVMVT